MTTLWLDGIIFTLDKVFSLLCELTFNMEYFSNDVWRSYSITFISII